MVPYAANYETLSQLFAATAPSLLSTAPPHSLQALELLPAGVIRMVHPLEGNEALVGFDLFASPDAAIAASARGSAADRGLSLTGPLPPLGGGGSAVLVVRKAVHLPASSDSETFGRPDEPDASCGEACRYNSTSGTKLWGFVAAMIQLDAFSSTRQGSTSPLRALAARGYRYTLTAPATDAPPPSSPSPGQGQDQSQGGSFLVASSGVEPAEWVEARVQLPDTEWVLRVGPSGACWLPAWFGGVMAAVVVAALAASLMLFGVLLSRSRHRFILKALLPRELLEEEPQLGRGSQSSSRHTKSESPTDQLMGVLGNLLSGGPPDPRDISLLRSVLQHHMQHNLAQRPAGLNVRRRIKNANLDADVARALIRQLGDGGDTQTGSRRTSYATTITAAAAEGPFAHRSLATTSCGSLFGDAAAVLTPGGAAAGMYRTGGGGGGKPPQPLYGCHSLRGALAFILSEQEDAAAPGPHAAGRITASGVELLEDGGPSANAAAVSVTTAAAALRVSAPLSGSYAYPHLHPHSQPHPSHPVLQHQYQHPHPQSHQLLPAHIKARSRLCSGSGYGGQLPRVSSLGQLPEYGPDGGRLSVPTLLPATRSACAPPPPSLGVGLTTADGGAGGGIAGSGGAGGVGIERERVSGSFAAPRASVMARLRRFGSMGARAGQLQQAAPPEPPASAAAAVTASNCGGGAGSGSGGAGGAALLGPSPFAVRFRASYNDLFNCGEDAPSDSVPEAAPPKPLLEEVERLLARADEWQFDTWALHEASGGHALSSLGFYLMQRAGLVKRFRMEPLTLARLLRTLEAGYLPNPYHNATHAADVLACLHALLRGAKLNAHYLDSLGLLAAYFSAIIHDYGHPGLTGDFLVATGHPLALRYNDRCPLESHHCAAAFSLMAERPELDALAGMTRAERAEFRKQVIDLVIATDMKQYVSILNSFTATHRLKTYCTGGGAGAAGQQPQKPAAQAPPAAANGAQSSPEARDGSVRGGKAACTVLVDAAEEEQEQEGVREPVPLDPAERTLSLQVALKVADIGHLGAKLERHERWLRLLEEEFFRQGDRERELGLPISPLFDRTKQGVSKSQVGFYDFVALPLIHALAAAFPGATPLLRCFEANYRHWKEVEAAAQAAAGPAAAAAVPAAGAAAGGGGTAAQQQEQQQPEKPSAAAAPVAAQAVKAGTAASGDGRQQGDAGVAQPCDCTGEEAV